MNSTWCGEPALAVVGGDRSVLLVVPGRSAKVTSLVDPDGHERLAQPRLPLGPPARPGDRFVDAEMCGWDECAPAVVVGRARVGERWVDVPDHGELWTARWRCRVAGDAVECDVRGIGQDYHLTRTIAPTHGGFQWTYEVRAGSTPVVLCWVAHPQLLAPAGSRVEVPGARVAVDVMSAGRPRRPWPVDGIAVDAVGSGGCAKVYAAPEVAVASARLSSPGRRSIVLTWDASVAPYCGIWVDRGAHAREDVVAVEPATGYADELPDAVGSGRVLRVAPGGCVSWWLQLHMG